MTPLNISLQELDALLQEGLDSGPSTHMTVQDWEEIRHEVGCRVAEQDGETQA